MDVEKFNYFAVNTIVKDTRNFLLEIYFVLHIINITQRKRVMTGNICNLLSNICLLLFILISIYIGIYTLYYAASVFFASRNRRIFSRHRYFEPPYENNIVMVIYSANNEGDVVSLLEMMNKQDYPKTNYQTHIILDNCSDEISNKLEFIGGAKIWRLGDGQPVGKDESVSWLLERLVSLQNVNAFAFLDAKRQISYDYLSNVNKELFHNDVIVAQTDFIDSKGTLTSKIRTVYNKYSNRIHLLSRRVRDLSVVIDSDACVIKQEVIEKIRCVDFKNIESELKYTTLLIKSGFDCLYSPNLVTKIDVEKATNRKSQPLYRFEMVQHCFGFFFKSRPQFSEFVLYNVKPNIWFLLLSYLGLLAFSYTYSFIFDFPVILSFFGILLLGFVASLPVAGIGKNEIGYLLLFPFYRSCKNLEKSKFYNSLIKMFKPKQTFINRDIATVDAIVTDGQNNLQCHLDLISEDGLARAVLRYKKKSYTSSSQIRMYDAVSDVVERLNQMGLRIKICHSCGLFTSKIDGSTNMVKGDCLKCKINPAVYEPMETLIWSSCDEYVPCELGKVIDIKDYRHN